MVRDDSLSGGRLVLRKGFRFPRLISGNTVRWLFPCVFSLLIITTLPIAPRFWDYILRVFGPSLPVILPGILIALFSLYLVLRVVLSGGLSRLKRLVWLGLCAGGAGTLILTRQYPAEKFHLVEYGILCWLFHWSLSGHPGRSRTGWAAWMMTTAVGIVDETIQHFLPSRVGDLSDVSLNCAAAGLTLILLTRVFPATPAFSRTSEIIPDPPDPIKVPVRP